MQCGDTSAGSPPSSWPSAARGAIKTPSGWLFAVTSDEGQQQEVAEPRGGITEKLAAAEPGICPEHSEEEPVHGARREERMKEIPLHFSSASWHEHGRALLPAKGGVLLSLTAAGPGGGGVCLSRDHVRNAVLKEELEIALAEDYAAGSAIYNSFAFTTDGAYFEPGFTVALPSAASEEGRTARTRILQLAAKHDQLSICEYLPLTSSAAGSAANCTMRIISTSGAELATFLVTMHNLSSMTISQAALDLAALPSTAFQVYPSLVDARASLQKTALVLSSGAITTALEMKKTTLLTAIDETLLKVDAAGNIPVRQGRSPSRRELLVVLEGLDGTGKTTLARGLQKRHGFLPAATPPPWASALRPAFDACGLPHLRRAFYAACNYEVAASELAAACAPLVLDRFAYSTVAYAVGAAVGQPEALPPSGSALWLWPSDLLPRPSLVVHLQLSSDERASRVSSRASVSAMAVTQEEAKLAGDSQFEQAVDVALSRCCETNKDSIPYLTVDAALPPAVLVQRVAAALGLK